MAAMRFALCAVLMGALGLLSAPAVYARDAFQVRLTANGQSRDFSFSKAEDAIDAFSNTTLQRLLPSYSPNAPARADVDLRGLRAVLEYPNAGPTLVLSVPSIGLQRTFTGPTREATEDQLEDFFKGREGGNTLTRVLQALAAQTPIDPVAGNPNSLLSRMGDADFSRGTNLAEGLTIDLRETRMHEIAVGIDSGWFSTDVSNQTVTTADITYRINLREAGFSLIFDLPISYADSEGSSAYFGSFGVGARFPITPNWAVTPILRVGGAASVDLASAAVIYSGSVVSDLRIPVAERWELQVGNMVGYYRTDGIVVGDYRIDYDLSNVRLKNGLSLAHSFAAGGVPVVGRAFVSDSRFFGDDLFIEQFNEVGLSFATRLGPVRALEIGGSYLFADEYDGFRANLRLTF